MRANIHKITTAGNTRSPGYSNAINWLSEIWSASEQIKNSFDICGITSQANLIY